MAPAPDAAPRPERDPRPGLSGLEPGVLEAWFAERGEPAYRARQVADAVWGGRAAATREARTLPIALRAEVDAAFRFEPSPRRPPDRRRRTDESPPRLSDGALIDPSSCTTRRSPPARAPHLCISSRRSRRRLPVWRPHLCLPATRDRRDRRPGPPAARRLPPTPAPDEFRLLGMVSPLPTWIVSLPPATPQRPAPFGPSPDLTSRRRCRPG